MFYLSTFLIITIFFIFIFLFLLPGNISKDIIFKLWYLFIIGLAVFSFFAEPSVNDDLFSHYYDIDQIRNGYGSKKSSLKGITIIFWLISRQPYNGLLPFLSVLIFGIVLAEIAKEYYSHNSYNSKALMIYFMMALSCNGIFYIVSGIRCSMVAVLWTLSYVKFYQKNKIKEFIIAELLLGLLHYIAFLFLIIHILYLILMKINKRRVWISCIIIFAIFIFVTNNSEFFANILKLLGSNSIGSLGDKWTTYTTEYVGGMEIENAFKLISVIILMFCYFYPATNKNETEKFTLYLAFIYISTRIGFVIIAERLPYLIGVISLPLVDNCIKGYKKGRIFIEYLLFMFFTLFLLYSFHTMFSHIMFNGYDIKKILNQFFTVW